MMRNLMPFLAYMMLLLTAWSGMAHSAEATICVESAQSGRFSHSGGDADQAPVDDEKRYPHPHKGCHGHHVGLAVLDQVAAQPTLRSGPFGVRKIYALASHRAGPALRPPQA